jgi:hypothetical protein
LSSSNPKQGFISCSVEHDKHIYFIDISPTSNETPNQVAGLSIMWNGKCAPTQTKLQFDWAPKSSEETTAPEIRIQYLKGDGFNPHFANVSKKEYTCTRLDEGANSVSYDLPFIGERKLLRVAILGRANKSTGVHVKIWNIKIGGLAPGKTLPWSLGAHDPILSKRIGNLNINRHVTKSRSTSPQIKAYDHNRIKHLYAKADKLIEKAWTHPPVRIPRPVMTTFELQQQQLKDSTTRSETETDNRKDPLCGTNAQRRRKRLKH